MLDIGAKLRGERWEARWRDAPRGEGGVARPRSNEPVSSQGRRPRKKVNEPTEEGEGGQSCSGEVKGREEGTEGRTHLTHQCRSCAPSPPS